MNDTTRRRLIGVGAIAIAAAALVYIATGNIGQNLVYYWTPTELVAAGNKAFGPTIRLGGLVERGTVDWNADAHDLKFKIGDGKATVNVRSDKAPAQMFREGIGVVVEGTYAADGVFTASRLMVKHDNEYRAPHPGDTPQSMFKTLADSDD